LEELDWPLSERLERGGISALGSVGNNARGDTCCWLPGRVGDISIILKTSTAEGCFLTGLEGSSNTLIEMEDLNIDSSRTLLLSLLRLASISARSPSLTSLTRSY